MRLTVKAEVYAGAEILTTATAAIELAKRLDANVEFDFNGVKCHASPDGNPEWLAQNQQNCQGENPKFKFVVSTRPPADAP